MSGGTSHGPHCDGKGDLLQSTALLLDFAVPVERYPEGAPILVGTACVPGVDPGHGVRPDEARVLRPAGSGGAPGPGHRSTLPGPACTARTKPSGVRCRRAPPPGRRCAPEGPTPPGNGRRRAAARRHPGTGRGARFPGWRIVPPAPARPRRPARPARAGPPLAPPRARPRRPARTRQASPDRTRSRKAATCRRHSTKAGPPSPRSTVPLALSSFPLPAPASATSLRARSIGSTLVLREASLHRARSTGRIPASATGCRVHEAIIDVWRVGTRATGFGDVRGNRRAATDGGIFGHAEVAAASA